MLQGKLHQHLRNPPTLLVNMPKGGTLAVHIRGVATLGARLQWQVDGRVEKVVDLPDRDGKNDAMAREYDQTLEFAIPPGRHRVTLDDVGGDWACIGWYAIKGETLDPYATGPGVGIQLHSPPHAGRLLIPCNHSVQPDPARPERFEYGDHAIYRDDHGATWRLGGAVPSLKIDEPQVVGLSDGSILMNSRSHFGLGCRTACLSRDGGQTWGAVRHERALIEPNCQAGFLRYDDATGGRPRLLSSNPASTTLRHRLTVRVSDDGGATWPAARLIDSGPCGVFVLDRVARRRDRLPLRVRPEARLGGHHVRVVQYGVAPRRRNPAVAVSRTSLHVGMTTAGMSSSKMAMAAG